MDLNPDVAFEIGIGKHQENINESSEVNRQPSQLNIISLTREQAASVLITVATKIQPALHPPPKTGMMEADPA